MDVNLLQNINQSDIEKFKLLSELFNKTSYSEAVTLRVFADEYSNNIKENRSAAYYLSVKNSLKHLTDFFGLQRPIQSISLRDVENFISQLQKKVTKGYRVYIRTLKAAFNKAIDWGYVKENYFLKVKLPKKQKVNPVFLSSDQLSVICDQLDENRQQYAVGGKQKRNNVVKDIVVFAFYTGLRLNEIIHLTWKNVDLENRIITVGDENFITKGRNQRYVPISNEVNEVLVKRERAKVRSEKGEARGEKSNVKSDIVKSKGNRQKEKDKKTYPRLIDLKNKVGDTSPDFIGIRVKEGFVFCKADGKPFTGDYVSKSFKRACNAAGVDKAIHFHSLRHSFASNLAQKGVSLYVIKELLGHSSITTTEIYSHLNVDSLRDAIRALDVKGETGNGKGERQEVRGERSNVKGEKEDGNSIPQIIKIKKINGGLK